jgi:hypothetical protein
MKIALATKEDIVKSFVRVIKHFVRSYSKDALVNKMNVKLTHVPVLLVRENVMKSFA